jgi:transcriptional regulator with XRE-family HTH domain
LQPLDAERVREWRHRRMLSQQELADRAGTSLFTIQRIERGEGNVRPKTGRGVAAALGVPIEELLPKAQAPLFREPLEREHPARRRMSVFVQALGDTAGRWESEAATATDARNLVGLASTVLDLREALEDNLAAQWQSLSEEERDQAAAMMRKWTSVAVDCIRRAEAIRTGEESAEADRSEVVDLDEVRRRLEQPRESRRQAEAHSA